MKFRLLSYKISKISRKIVNLQNKKTMNLIRLISRKTFASLLVMFSTIFCASPEPPQAPALRHVLDIHAECGEARLAGEVPGGKRVMIPISGGYVDGGISARILPGGADYQMVDTVRGRVKYDAIYTILTSDSVMVNVRNQGVSVPLEKGQYFTTSPRFEAPVDSPYDWLNNRIFVCRPIGFGKGIVHLRVWVAE